MKRIPFFLTLLTARALMAGCGLDQASVASQEATRAPAGEAAVLLAFSPEAAQQAASLPLEAVCESCPSRCSPSAYWSAHDSMPPSG